jgi:hypothetical protein
MRTRWWPGWGRKGRGEGTRRHRPPAAAAVAAVKGRRGGARRQGWGHEGEEEKNGAELGKTREMAKPPLSTLR